MTGHGAETGSGPAEVPEFSRPLAIEAIEAAAEKAGGGEVVETITADTAERAALAERFSLEALDRLTATLRLRRRLGGRSLRVEGTLEAAVVQTCVVTLEPVPAEVEESFAVDFLLGSGPEGAAGAAEIVLDAGNPEEPEPLEGGVIDLGELVAQHLYLALDPYPRAPGVEFTYRDGSAEGDARENPFAALTRLRPRS